MREVQIGAACGPLATGFFLAYVSAEIQHGVVAVVMAAGLIHWLRERT